LPAGLEVPPVAEQPSGDDVARARELILDELLADFPFVTDADRAHAVALMLVTFVRSVIDGPTPLHMPRASTPGTGKGLLTDVCLLPATGGLQSRMAVGRDEDEMRKRLTALLIEGRAVALLDNLPQTQVLESAALAAALTSQIWSDRLLGASRTVTAKVRCVWVATGNNPLLSTELARRSVGISLDADMEEPWLRVRWKHPYLRRWARDNRPRLVWACLTLVRAWQAAGCPPGQLVLGEYESWSEVVGGVLTEAGIGGFLSNLREFYSEADVEQGALRSFVEGWAESYPATDVTAANLLSRALAADLDLGRGEEQSQKTRLGLLLRRNRGRVFGPWRIVEAGKYQGAKLWKLEPKDKEEEP
jgi:hypothetical protein